MVHSQYSGRYYGRRTPGIPLGSISKTLEELDPPEVWRQLPLDLCMIFQENWSSFYSQNKHHGLLPNYLGNLNDFKEVTTKELVNLEAEACKKRQQLLQLSRFLIPINERPYLTQYLGHQLFSSTQKKGVLYYKLAFPVKVLVFNHSGPIDGSIEIEYSLDDKSYSKGCLLCGSGIMLGKCPEKTADVINCYLPLLKHGGIDLCTGSLAPSFSPSLDDLTKILGTIRIFNQQRHSHKRNMEENTGNIPKRIIFTKDMGYWHGWKNSLWPSRHSQPSSRTFLQRIIQRCLPRQPEVA